MKIGNITVLRRTVDRTRQLEAVLPWHHDVHQNQVGLFFGQTLEGLIGILGRAHDEPVLLQQDPSRNMISVLESSTMSTLWIGISSLLA
jgi:hypothetical protein